MSTGNGFVLPTLLTTSLEIELGVPEEGTGQSFADRNGRGSKKNKNLVIAFDTSAAISQLRSKVVKGTIFEGRLADGRTQGATVTATGFRKSSAPQRDGRKLSFCILKEKP